MKKDLIIFGTGKIAEVVYYYAKEECNFNVVAFTVDSAYAVGDTFCNLPIVPFENINQNYPSDKFNMFVAVGYQDLNRLREKKCNEVLAKGYSLISIISPLANVPKNVKTGYNCFIMSPAIIHPCVEIGNDVFVWAGAMIGHHSKIANHVWFTSCANIGGNVTVGSNCFFAMNATVGHSVTLGKECFIGANALVTKNMEDKKVVIAESQKPIKLDSEQFLRLSKFSSI